MNSGSFLSHASGRQPLDLWGGMSNIENKELAFEGIMESKAGEGRRMRGSLGYLARAESR